MIIAQLYVKVMDNDGEVLQTVESIDIMIDDIIYSYESMLEGSSSSSVLLDKEAKTLIEALADATEVTVRIGTNKGYTTIEMDKSEFTTSLKQYCKNILNYNVLDYLVYDDDTLQTALKLFPLTITK